MGQQRRLLLQAPVRVIAAVTWCRKPCTIGSDAPWLAVV
jgi:hypothetical protein